MRIRVLADDLTGAADAGVAFAPARLLIAADTTAWSGPAQVVAADADSRDGTEDTARARVRMFANGLLAADISLKKIDSTLRGHVAAELAELRTVVRATEPDAAIVVAPAFPEMGRTVRDGVLRVHGQAPSGRIDQLVPAHLIGLRDVRSDASDLVDRLAAVRGVAACDAATDDDLDRIVAAGSRVGRRVVWVGSGGLAKALARGLVGSPRTSEFPLATRFLAVVGSPLAARQAAALAQDGVTIVEIPVAAAVSGDRRWTRRIADALNAGSVVVRLTGPRHAETAAVAAGLATICAPVLPCADLVVLAGGETARAVLTAGGITELDIVAEPDPGIVLSSTGKTAPAHIMTKAGSFGDDDALRRALRRTMTRGKGQQ